MKMKLLGPSARNMDSQHAQIEAKFVHRLEALVWKERPESLNKNDGTATRRAYREPLRIIFLNHHGGDRVMAQSHLPISGLRSSRKSKSNEVRAFRPLPGEQELNSGLIVGFRNL